MSRLSDNLKALDSFRALNENWDGYGAKPLPHDLIERMRTLIWILPIQPEIFPTARESIQFEYDCDNGSHIEFEMFTDGTLCILEVDKDENFKERKLSYDVPTICEVVREFFARCN
jgi:hypothetical protein